MKRRGGEGEGEGGRVFEGFGIHGRGGALPPRRNALSQPSHARPAPKPKPTHAGQARRLNSSTEKMTPNERPSVERMASDDRQ